MPRCGTVLLAGPDDGEGGAWTGADVDAICEHATAATTALTWGLIAAGALVALAGWTGLRESGRSLSR